MVLQRPPTINDTAKKLITRIREAMEAYHKADNGESLPDYDTAEDALEEAHRVLDELPQSVAVRIGSWRTLLEVYNRDKAARLRTRHFDEFQIELFIGDGAVWLQGDLNNDGVADNFTLYTSDSGRQTEWRVNSVAYKHSMTEADSAIILKFCQYFFNGGTGLNEIA